MKVLWKSLLGFYLSSPLTLFMNILGLHCNAIDLDDKEERLESYHDTAVYEATPKPGRPQMWILLRAGDLDVPNLLPGLVEALVDGIDARVVRTHAVTATRRYPVLLSELLVQRHVQLQVRHVLVQVGLLMVPHVGKPRKSVNIANSLVYPFFLY